MRLVLLHSMILGLDAATHDGVMLLQTHASILTSDSVHAVALNNETAMLARREVAMQGVLAGYDGMYRFHAPVSVNKDIPVRADAPQFRQRIHARPKIFFVHNNKCGGSALCYIAQVNGEKSPVRGDHWGCEPPHEPGEDRDEALIGAATFREVQGITPKLFSELKAANDTILMTILRDPVARVVSEWRHYGYRWDPKAHDTTLRPDWTDEDPRRDDMDALIEYHSTRDPEEMHANVGGTNRTQAIAALHGYDLVLITEDLDAVDLARLRTIGWTSLNSGASGHLNSGSTLGAGSSESAYDTLGPKRTKRLQELFAADVALYKAAVVLAKEQRRVQL